MTYEEKLIQSLEAELKKPLTNAVKAAINNEITRLRKKITGPGKGRKAKAADGVFVGVGAKVYSYEMPYMGYAGLNKPEEERAPAIKEQVVEAINRVGRVRLAGWIHEHIDLIDLTARRYYSSRAAAHAAMVSEAQRDVKRAKESALRAMSDVEQRKHFLAVCKAFNPNAAPAKAARKKRAA